MRMSCSQTQVVTNYLPEQWKCMYNVKEYQMNKLIKIIPALVRILFGCVARWFFDNRLCWSNVVHQIDLHK